MAAEDRLPQPASADFIHHLHHEFYRDAPEQMLPHPSCRPRDPHGARRMAIASGA